MPRTATIVLGAVLCLVAACGSGEAAGDEPGPAPTIETPATDAPERSLDGNGRAKGMRAEGPKTSGDDLLRSVVEEPADE